MTLPLPRSLAGRTIILVFLGLTISHLLSMLIYTGDRADSVEAVAERSIVQRIANASHLLATSPPAWQDKLASNLADKGFNVSIGPATTPALPVQPSRHTTELHDYLSGQLHGAVYKEIRLRLFHMDGEIEVSDNSLFDRIDLYIRTATGHPGLRKVLTVSLLTGDDGWHNFRADIPNLTAFWTTTSILSVSAMGGAIILFSWWMVRRLTQPLRTFTTAARRLGRDVHAPLLPEEGSTEVVEATRAFNEMQQRLQRLIDNRTRMLGAISHDLRTPITLLRLRLEAMPGSEDQEKMLVNLDHMEQMIAASLDLARVGMQQEEEEITDLGALVESLCADFSDTGKAVIFEPGDRILTACQPVALTRAITNLVENALKYAGAAEVSFGKHEAGLFIDVCDNGPGVPQSELESILEPFHRLEASRSRDTGGVGLGLSITQSIAATHGGTLNLSNRKTGGLRARIVIPGGTE